MNKGIIIICWTGRTLFDGNYDDPKVKNVLDVNRCPEIESHCDFEICHVCNDSGYQGDFEVFWKVESLIDHRDDNVYEFIDY